MRHLNPKPEVHERVCPFCPEHVEDEMHFLVGCKNFKIHRETLFSHASNVLVGFQHLSHKQKLIKLANDPLIVKATAKYLRKTFELREFLLKPHKEPG